MDIIKKINQKDLKKYAPVVLRFGLAFVFMWFGSNQLMNPGMWTAMIPEWLTALTGISAATFVFMNAIFEVAAAILLIIGIQIRIVATLLFLHMIMIIIELGLTAIGIRDIGLAASCLAIALHGADAYSQDREIGTLQ